MELSLRTMTRGAKVGVLALGFTSAMLLTNAMWTFIPYFETLGLMEVISVFLGACLFVMIVHEALHGTALKMCGGEVKYGVKSTKLGPAFYATSPSVYSKRKFQLAALAPQVMTILCLAVLATGPPPLVALGLVVAAAGNLGGGCFDLYTVFLLKRFSKDSRVQDTIDGVRVVATS